MLIFLRLNGNSLRLGYIEILHYIFFHKVLQYCHVISKIHRCFSHVVFFIILENFLFFSLSCSDKNKSLF